jgi:predicted aspartyl protease
MWRLSPERKRPVRNLLAIALLGTASPLLAQTAPAPPVAPPPAGAVVDTEFDKSYRMTVPVKINGQGPFQFIIDTGADRTVVSTALADKLGLLPGKKAVLHAMGGVANVRTVKVDSVQVSSNISRNVTAAALDAKNMGADGILGIDSLKNQRIVIDFLSQTMRVEPSSEPEEAKPANSELIIVTARTRLGQLVMVDADANGQKLWVVVDTGAQNTIGNTMLRRTLAKQVQPGELKSVTLLDVIGRETVADYTIVNKLRIGGIIMGKAAVAFVDAHPFRLFGLTKRPSMLLGMESLRSFRRVSVDFATRKVKFLLNDTGETTRDYLISQSETSPAT